MKRFVTRLASPRLTVGLLLALALLGALGTAIPQGMSASEYSTRYPILGPLVSALGLNHFFAGAVYRGAMALFTANLLACAVGRSVQSWRHFRGVGTGSARTSFENPSWPEILRGRGFRVTSPSPLRASRRSWAFLGFPLVHLAPPVILMGGLWGSTLGLVATKNVHVGDFTLSAYDWADHADRPLPFALVVEDLRRTYYPLQLQVQALAPGTPSVVELREGDVVPVPDTRYRLRVSQFDPANGDMVYFVLGPDGERGPFSRGHENGAPLRARPLAYRDPEVRRVEARIALRGPSAETEVEAWVAVNQPLVHRGYRIYLTAWGDDAEGKPFAGLQIAKDPGQPLVWTASAALSVGLFLILFGDGAWVREEDGVLVCRASRGAARARAFLADPAAERTDSSEGGP